MVTGFYTGLLGLILLALMFRVVHLRMKYKVGLGDGGIPIMERAIRAHANFIECVPFILIEMFILEIQGMHHWFLHLFGAVLVFARIIHAWGLYLSPYRSPGRVFGIMICQILMLTGAALLIYQFAAS